MCRCTSQKSSTYVYYYAYVCYVCVECTYVHCVHCTYRIGIQIRRHTHKCPMYDVRLYDSIPLSSVCISAIRSKSFNFCHTCLLQRRLIPFQHARSNVHVNYIPCMCVYTWGREWKKKTESRENGRKTKTKTKNILYRN